jgi:hypothetical protein
LNLTRRLHQCTPELFWAEDPLSLRCWGNNEKQVITKDNQRKPQKNQRKTNKQERKSKEQLKENQKPRESLKNK